MGRTSKTREERKERHRRFADRASQKELSQLQQRARSLKLSEYGSRPGRQADRSVAGASSDAGSSVRGLSDIDV